MYNTILIPIDMEHVAKAGPMFDTAKANSSDQTRIILLNVIDEIPGWATTFMSDSMSSQPHQSIRDELSTIASKENLDAEIQVLTGHSYHTILQVAKKTKTDLVIVASHHPGYGDYFLGSTAAKIVRHAKCSVFVIR